MSADHFSLHAFDDIAMLYRQHHGWLRGWLQRKVGNAFDAADLAQATFLRVLAPQGMQGVQEPRAYLTTIARNLLINHVRRRAIEQAYLDALMLLPEESVPSPEQRWLLLEALQALDELLDGLPVAVRRAFLWSQLEGLGYAEIAERLQVSERTIKRYMAQAYEHCLLVEW